MSPTPPQGRTEPWQMCLAMKEIQIFPPKEYFWPAGQQVSQRSCVAKQELIKQDIPWNNGPSYLSVLSQHLPPSPAPKSTSAQPWAGRSFGIWWKRGRAEPPQPPWPWMFTEQRRKNVNTWAGNQRTRATLQWTNIPSQLPPKWNLRQ